MVPGAGGFAGAAATLAGASAGLLAGAGLFATVLTMLVLPVFYSVFFRVKYDPSQLAG